MREFSKSLIFYVRIRQIYSLHLHYFYIILFRFTKILSRVAHFLPEINKSYFKILRNYISKFYLFLRELNLNFERPRIRIRISRVNIRRILPFRNLDFALFATRIGYRKAINAQHAQDER